MFTIIRFVCNVCKLFVMQNVTLFVGPVGIIVLQTFLWTLQYYFLDFHSFLICG